MDNPNEENRQDELQEILEKLYEAFLKVIGRNVLYMFYQLIKGIVLINILKKNQEQCNLPIDIWIEMIIILDFCYVFYFSGAIIAHIVIYKLKKRNILSFNQMQINNNNNNNQGDGNSVNMSQASRNSGNSRNRNGNRSRQRISINANDFLYHSNPDQINEGNNNEQNQIQQNNQQNNQQNQQDDETNFLFTRQEYNNFIVMNPQNQWHSIIQEIDGMDNYQNVSYLNQKPEDFFKVLVLIRHINHFSYFVTYVWGLYIYLYSDEDCANNAPELLEVMFILILLSSLYIFIPIIIIITLIMLLPFFMYFQNQNGDQNNNQNQFILQDTYVQQIREDQYDKDKYADQDDFCLICWLNFENHQPIKILPCNDKHFFHKDCIKKWLSLEPKCPICRQLITPEMIEKQATRLF